MTNEFYYFGYGSNMDWARMKKRCPESVAIGVAKLPEHKVVERKFADIEPCKNSTVFGVLYKISEDDLTALDHYEGYPDGYDRKYIDVYYQDQKHKAIVYEMTESYREFNQDIPYSDEYKKLCYDAAAHWDLPINAYE